MQDNTPKTANKALLANCFSSETQSLSHPKTIKKVLDSCNELHFPPNTDTPISKLAELILSLPSSSTPSTPKTNHQRNKKSAAMTE